MTINTNKVTGYVVFPDDTIRAGSRVVFTMTGFDTDADDSAAVVPFPIKAEIASDGLIDVDLWPNPEGVRYTLYKVSAEVYNGVSPITVDLGAIEVPVSGGPFDLSGLLPVEVYDQ